MSSLAPEPMFAPSAGGDRRHSMPIVHRLRQQGRTAQAAPPSDALRARGVRGEALITRGVISMNVSMNWVSERLDKCPDVADLEYGCVDWFRYDETDRLSRRGAVHGQSRRRSVKGRAACALRRDAVPPGGPRAEDAATAVLRVQNRHQQVF